MSNILIVPNSGSIYFSTGLVGSSTIPNLSSGVAFQFDNSAGVNITSYATGVSANDRFSVDGYNGRLFNVSDNLTGVIFSVNDAAGLPIIEVDSSTVDKITMGTYASNTFVINDNKVGIGTGVPAAKLDIFDNVLAGSAGLSGSILNLNQTWNTSGTPSAIKLNVTDTTSNANSLLMDLEVSGLNRFSVQKNSFTTIGASDAAVSAYMLKLVNQYGNVGFQVGGGGRLDILNNGNAVASFFSNPGGITIAGDTLRIGTNLLLNRDADNIFAQRNATNPQSFRLYNTHTDATTFERLNLKWDTNVLKIGTEKGSVGGAARNLALETDSTTRMTITSAGNIGIGIINPTTLLHLRDGVSTTLKIEGYSTGAVGVVPAISFHSNNNQGNYESARIEGYGYHPGGYNNLNFYINNGSGVLSRMWQMDSAGNLIQNPGASSSELADTGIDFKTKSTNSNNFRIIKISQTQSTGYAGVSLRLQAGDANSAATGSFNFGGKIFVYGGKAVAANATPKDGDVVLAHDGTNAIGNVGIGTATPASKVTVTGGDIEITDTTAGVIFKTPDGTKRYRMTIDNAGAPVFTLLA